MYIFNGKQRIKAVSYRNKGGSQIIDSEWILGQEWKFASNRHDAVYAVDCAERYKMVKSSRLQRKKNRKTQHQQRISHNTHEET